MPFLDAKLLATTGRFFFSDGSSLEPSAGLFTPPTGGNSQVSITFIIHTKPATQFIYDIGTGHILTGGTSFEVVVVLGDVGKDAQPVRDP